MSHLNKKYLVIGGGVSIILILLGVLISGIVLSNTNTKKDGTVKFTETPTPTQTTSSKSVTWNFINGEWKSSDTPPTCAEKLFTISPVDVSLATSILYPGQIRGTDYKPHGGFRFDKSLNDDIVVKLPMNAKLVEVSQYIEMGEVQYLMDFVNACGIRFRFDHLRALSPTFQAIFSTLPSPKVDDSRTTPIASDTEYGVGEVVAISVGFKNTKNVGVDFGVYDLRQKNKASMNTAYSKNLENKASQAFYAICWLNEFPTQEAGIVKSLPAGDSKSGKTSDYCQL